MTLLITNDISLLYSGTYLNKYLSNIINTCKLKLHEIASAKTEILEKLYQGKYSVQLWSRRWRQRLLHWNVCFIDLNWSTWIKLLHTLSAPYFINYNLWKGMGYHLYIKWKWLYVFLFPKISENIHHRQCKQTLMYP